MPEQNSIKYINKRACMGEPPRRTPHSLPAVAVSLKPGLDSAKPLAIKPSFFFFFFKLSFLSQIKHPERGGHGIKLHGIPEVARD